MRYLVARGRAGAAVVVLSASLLLAGCTGQSDAERVSDTSNDVAFAGCDQVECSGVLPGGGQFTIELPEQWNGTLLLYSPGMRADAAPPELQPLGGAQAAAQTGEAPAADPGPVVEDEPAVVGEPAVAESAAGAAAAPETAPEPSGDPGPADAGSADPGSADAELSAVPEPVPAGPQAAPDLTVDGEAFTELLLDAGFAIAGATPVRDGWAPADQAAAAEELHAYFAANVAEPNRVYAWGPSTGGLGSVLLAESGNDWVSGVVALCAPLAGARPTYDLALDVAVATRALFVADLVLTGYGSQEQANAEYVRAADALRAAADGTPEERARFQLIAALVDAASQSAGEATGREAQVEALLQLLARSTVERYGMEQRLGGNPTGNVGTDYRLRITPEEWERVTAGLGDPAAAAGWLEAVQLSERVVPDPAAEAALAGTGEVTGEIGVPVLSLHNEHDPVFGVGHTGWYRARTGAVSDDAGANYIPITITSGAAGKLGAGHCNFQPGHLSAALRTLDDWVRRGVYPGEVTLTDNFATGSALDTDYQPPAWPWARLSPLDPPLDPALDPTAAEPAGQPSPAEAGSGGAAVPDEAGAPSPQ